jgi:hypothetical protein
LLAAATPLRLPSSACERAFSLAPLAVTKDSFDEARASGKVPVVYDGNDPWNNSPVRQPGWKGVTDSPWFFFLGGLPFLAVGAFLLLLGFGLLFVRRLPPLSPGP